MKERQRLRSEDATLLALKWKGTQAKECNRRPPEKGKGKEIDSLLDSRKECSLILGLPTSRLYNKFMLPLSHYICGHFMLPLSHYICGHLLQKQQKTNTSGATVIINTLYIFVL